MESNDPTASECAAEPAQSSVSFSSSVNQVPVVSVDDDSSNTNDNHIAVDVRSNMGGVDDERSSASKEPMLSKRQKKAINDVCFTFKDSTHEERLGDSDAADALLLSRAVHDAGRWAFGTVAVEVWILNDQRTHLFRPDGGFWVDPAFTMNDSLKRLVDDTRPDHVPPHDLAPGVGLAGALWAEAQQTTAFMPNIGLGKGRGPAVGTAGSARGGGRSYRASQSTGRLSTMRMRAPMTHTEREKAIDARTDREEEAPTDPDQTGRGKAYNYLPEMRKVVWRDVVALAVDPDQPYNPRLALLGKAGFGLAAGVPFNVDGHRGIVVYCARATADQTKLKAQTNEAYLRSATNVIGAAWAVREPRRQAVAARRAERGSAIRRARIRLLAMVRMGINVSQLAQPPPKKQQPIAPIEHEEHEKHNACKDFWKGTKDKIISTARKCRGGNVEPPPPMPLTQSLWSLFGVLVTLLMLSRFNEWVKDLSNNKHSLVMGPFGALMTLQYGLTAAPASQPRNAILGQTISILIAIGFANIDNMEPWIKSSIAPALAIFCMVKLGVTHPPAGASALIFASSSTREWTDMGLMLVGNVLCIGTATIINNSVENRQYPTFWGFKYLEKMIRDKKKVG